MIGSICNHGTQTLYSQPSVNLSPKVATDSNSAQESPRETPVPADTQKVHGAVTSQEGQASKKQLPDAQTNKPTQNTHSPIALSEEELKQVQDLKQRDIEVRAHEAAHLAAAGQHAQGGAKFTLKRGPDGKSYAVGGSVSIDTSPEASPEATLRKAEQIKRAALAPAEPSGQDRSVAAQAAKLKLEAQAEIAEQQRIDSPTSDDQINANSSETSGNPTTIGADKENVSSSTDSAEVSSSFVEDGKAAAKYLCEICSGDHATAPHLEANQRKAGQYLAVGQS